MQSFLHEKEWKSILSSEFTKSYFLKLEKFLKVQFSTREIFPPINEVFNAFNYTPFSKVKVVIVGQDPYHQPGQANGLSFSVNRGIVCPPSLRNIFKEYNSDLGFEIPKHGDLTCWAKEGVLLLNTTLTVEKSLPGSHFSKGWETFTDRIISLLNASTRHIVYILWGKFAQAKMRLIDTNRAFVIKSSHPSPFSVNRGFIRSKPFSHANELLVSTNQETINWKIY